MSKCGFCNKCSSVQYYCHCCPSSSELCTSQRSIDQIVNLYYRQAVAIDREVLSCLRSRLLWKFDWNGTRGARRQFRETANFRYGPSRAEHNISIEGEFRFTNEGEEIRSRARTYRMHLNWNSGQHAVHCTAPSRLEALVLCRTKVQCLTSFAMKSYGNVSSAAEKMVICTFSLRCTTFKLIGDNSQLGKLSDCA